MDVIVRTTGGTPSGDEPPTEIDTGSAGLVGPGARVDLHRLAEGAGRAARSVAGGRERIRLRRGRRRATRGGASARADRGQRRAAGGGRASESARWCPSRREASGCPTATGSASARSVRRATGSSTYPTTSTLAGWWSGGSRLGDPFGSTLVAAHVDSRTQGLGPFASLLGVRAGDRVRVWSDGLRQAFEVTSLRLRPQGTIGAGSWLHSPEGPRRLTLVTCAGPYDAARGGYQNLAVITATPLDHARRRP